MSEDLALTRATDRHMSALLGERERHARAYEDAEHQIRTAFALIGKVPACNIALPMVTVDRHGRVIEGTQNVPAAIRDHMDNGPVFELLINIIEESKCPLVSELRSLLSNEYVSQHADELASYRGEE